MVELLLCSSSRRHFDLKTKSRRLVRIKSPRRKMVNLVLNRCFRTRSKGYRCRLGLDLIHLQLQGMASSRRTTDLQRRGERPGEEVEALWERLREVRRLKELQRERGRVNIGRRLWRHHGSVAHRSAHQWPNLLLHRYRHLRC